MAKTPLPPEAAKDAVCARLVTLRRALGLNAKGICELTGLSTTQWANYEALERLPNILDMVRVSQATGAPLDYIYMGRMDRVPFDLAVKISEVEAADAPTVRMNDIAARQARFTVIPSAERKRGSRRSG